MLRKRLPPDPDASSRPPSFSDGPRFNREDRKAGSSPAFTPAASAAPSKKRNTRQSGFASNLTGLSVAILTDEKRLVAHSAITAPATPLIRPSSALSLSSS